MTKTPELEERIHLTRISKACRLADELTEDDLRAGDQMVADQIGYMHPFKGETQSRLNKLGAANKVIIAKLRELRTAVAALKEIPQ